MCIRRNQFLLDEQRESILAIADVESYLFGNVVLTCGMDMGMSIEASLIYKCLFARFAHEWATLRVDQLVGFQSTASIEGFFAVFAFEGPQICTWKSQSSRTCYKMECVSYIPECVRICLVRFDLSQKLLLHSGHVCLLFLCRFSCALNCSWNTNR